jgi:hypothetical protein
LSNPESQDRVSPSVNARKVLTFSDEAGEDMPTTTTTIHETNVDKARIGAASTLLELLRRKNAVLQRHNSMEEEEDDDKTEEGMDTQGDDSLSDVAVLGDNEAVSPDFTDKEMVSLLDMFVPTKLDS